MTIRTDPSSRSMQLEARSKGKQIRKYDRLLRLSLSQRCASPAPLISQPIEICPQEMPYSQKAIVAGTTLSMPVKLEKIECDVEVDENNSNSNSTSTVSFSMPPHKPPLVKVAQFASINTLSREASIKSKIKMKTRSKMKLKNNLSTSVIYLSSDDDDFEPSQTQRTPKKAKKGSLKRKVSSNQLSPKPANRVKLEKVAQNCKKIVDFFDKSPDKFLDIKREPKRESISTKSFRSNSPIEVFSDSDDKSGNPLRVKLPTIKRLKDKHLPSNPITSIVVERKLTNGTDLRRVSKKYFDENQTFLPGYIDVRTDETRIGRFETFEQTAMPFVVTGNMDIDRFLEALNDQKDIRADVKDNENNERVLMLNCDGEEANDMVDRLLTQLKQEPDDEKLPKIEMGSSEADALQLLRSPKPLIAIPNEVLKKAIGFFPPPVSSKKCMIRSKVKQKVKEPKPLKTKKTCPSYKIVAGTTFAVDAFQFGLIDGVTKYFLSHFHADHYIGLRKSFAMPIYMSSITARLVATFINVDPQYLHVLEMNKATLVENVEVTLLDANHCPGAVMFLFKLVNGSCILHTGDFRASPIMEEEKCFWNCKIDILYLDTTYLTSKYAFKPQWESIDDANRAVKKFLTQNIGEKTLIVCGSYLIGKEKVWIEIASENNLSIWTEPNRKKALHCYGSKQLLSLLVDFPEDANLHVIAMQKLSYDFLVKYLDSFGDKYTHLLALRPSGWEKNSKPQYRGRVTIVGIEYSEHSSYEELQRFVRFIECQNVISTVPYGKDLSKTPKIPKNWLDFSLKPRVTSYQPSITNYLKIVPKSEVVNGASSQQM